MVWIYGLCCAAVPAVTFVATADPSVPVYLQYGLLGPVMGALWWVYRREVNRADRLEEKLLEAIPALTQATLALNESTEILREIHRGK